VTNAPSPFRSGPSLPSSPLLSSPCPHSGHIFFFFLLNLQTGNSLSHNTQERRPLTPAQSRPPPALPAQASDARPRGAQGTPLSRWRHPSPGEYLLPPLGLPRAAREALGGSAPLVPESHPGTATCIRTVVRMLPSGPGIC
jgi:hypothetical protein